MTKQFVCNIREELHAAIKKKDIKFKYLVEKGYEAVCNKPTNNAELIETKIVSNKQAKAINLLQLRILEQQEQIFEIKASIVEILQGGSLDGIIQKKTKN